MELVTYRPLLHRGDLIRKWHLANLTLSWNTLYIHKHIFENTQFNVMVIEYSSVLTRNSIPVPAESSFHEWRILWFTSVPPNKHQYSTLQSFTTSSQISITYLIQHNIYSATDTASL